MRMRPLGGSGIEVSTVILGAWAIGGWQWGGIRESEAIDAIHAAPDNGINCIDTAPVYGWGRSEELVGKALQGGLRHRMVVASKCALVWDGSGEDGTYLYSGGKLGKVPDDSPERVCRVFINTRPQHIRRGLEDSLRRLRTDYIDLFQTHWQDATTPIEDTMAELLKMKREGKIRAIGCSNATPEQMDRYRALGPLDVDQEKFSMLDRAREKDCLPYCAENGIAFLAYSPLGQGLLTGAVGPERVFGPDDMRSMNPRFSLESRKRIADFLQTIRPIADDYRLSYAQLVTAWTLAQPGCSHAILGARNVEQVRENAKGGAVVLDDAAVLQITEQVGRFLKDS